MTVKTFHGDPALKDKLLARIAAHERADSIAQGAYWREIDGQWKGCAVGCSLRDLTDHSGEEPADGWHVEMERVLGVPEWLARLEDTVFEGLSVEDAKGWPRRFSEAVSVGADLADLADRLAIRRLREECLPLSGQWLDSVRAQVVAAIEQTIAALESKDDEQLRAAESAAWSAASAAWSARAAARAAESAAWSAESAAWSARSAAWSAAWSARSAARAAAESAAWSARAAAESAIYKRESDRIVEELLLIGSER